MAPREIDVELFRDAAGAWRFRLRFSNGKIAATSEAYTSKAKARKSAEAVVDGIHRFQPAVEEV